MKAVFRVDSSAQMGIGHLMRCLALADALRDSGVQAEFISRQLTGHTISQTEQRGYRVYPLPAPVEPLSSLQNTGLRHQAWLGCSQAEDAAQCAPILQQIKPDWLIVDHYALDIEWENALTPYRKQLMVIDDLADRPHNCNLLLDQNWFSASTQSRYDPLVPADCVKMLGPAFALLKPEFSQLRLLLPAKDGYIRRVLVSMGGSDPSNETLKVLRALMQPELQHLVVDVVCGVNHQDMKAIEDMAAQRGATNIYRSLPTLSGLMARADLMIGAGGTTTWERMCLGLPAIVISLAANQYQPNLSLAQDGYILFAGPKEEVTIEKLQQLICSLTDNRNLYLQLSQAAQILVTGTGINQVVNTVKNLSRRYGSSYGTSSTD
ncbi:UDP-2,4-diacetamido-2,4,6-trideoxy-beta-L-altropyranose hydrolase [Rheinheimera sp.]|uniref:UDP-2,4-diacetamido-2,4, 6-trideoxy-beta-L-altropyranose hydrolase n=1 Tax=Rheinheimera sp. TaxID=1869214 RepID=UPI00307EC102